MPVLQVRQRSRGPVRVAFASPVSTPGEARRALIELLGEARTRLGLVG